MHRTRIITRSRVRPPEPTSIQPLSLSTSRGDRGLTRCEKSSAMCSTSTAGGTTSKLTVETTQAIAKHGPKHTRSRRKTTKCAISSPPLIPPIDDHCTTDTFHTERQRRGRERPSDSSCCLVRTVSQQRPSAIASKQDTSYIDSPIREETSLAQNSLCPFFSSQLSKAESQDNTETPLVSTFEILRNNSGSERTSSNNRARSSHGLINASRSKGFKTVRHKHSKKNSSRLQNFSSEKETPKWSVGDSLIDFQDGTYIDNRSCRSLLGSEDERNSRNKYLHLNSCDESLYSPVICCQEIVRSEAETKSCANDFDFDQTHPKSQFGGSILEETPNIYDSALDSHCICKDPPSSDWNSGHIKKSQTDNALKKSRLKHSRIEDFALGLYFSRVLRDIQKSIHSLDDSSDTTGCVQSCLERDIHVVDEVEQVEQLASVEDQDEGDSVTDISENLQCASDSIQGGFEESITFRCEPKQELVVSLDSHLDEQTEEAHRDEINVSTKGISESEDDLFLGGPEPLIEKGRPSVITSHKVHNLEQPEGGEMPQRDRSIDVGASEEQSFAIIHPDALASDGNSKDVSGVSSDALPPPSRRKRRKRIRRPRNRDAADGYEDDKDKTKAEPEIQPCISCASFPSSESDMCCLSCRETFPSTANNAAAASLSSPERLRMCSSPSFTYDPDIASQIPFYFTEPDFLEENGDVATLTSLSPSRSPLSVLADGRSVHEQLSQYGLLAQCTALGTHRGEMDEEEQDSGRSSCSWDEFDNDSLLEAVVRSCDLSLSPSSSPNPASTCDYSHEAQTADDACSIVTVSDDVFSDGATHTSSESLADDLGRFR